MKEKREVKIFFYTYPEDTRPEYAAFQDLLVNLADGFNKIGIRHYASHNYWKISPEKEEYLLKANSAVSHHDCDIVILERQWFARKRSLPPDLFCPSRKYITVYLDCADGIRTSSWLPEFRQFDIILKTHCTKGINYPSNIRPWAFGLSNRVLKELDSYIPTTQRNRKLLVNFRPRKHNHSLRAFVQKTFIPEIKSILPVDNYTNQLSVSPDDSYHYLKWVQTGRRHYPGYYRHLSRSLACAAFGGFFLGPRFADSNPKLTYYLSKLIGKLGLKSNRISQWDSWRLWESLAAGCSTIHVDFEKYGFLLPKQPENWKHYIGIDLDNTKGAIERLMDEPKMFETVSERGREWAIQNYSPEAVAKRFIQIVKP